MWDKNVGRRDSETLHRLLQITNEVGVSFVHVGKNGGIEMGKKNLCQDVVSWRGCVKEFVVIIDHN